MHPEVTGNNEPPSHHGGLENLDQEFSYWIDDIEGEIPRDLVGTFFRNGPGRQRIGETKYGHWFDGDGMLAAFTFRDGRAHFKNAYVRTPKYIRETESETVCYRGFGTLVPVLPLLVSLRLRESSDAACADGTGSGTKSGRNV